MRYKTRKGKLQEKLNQEIHKSNPDVAKVIEIIEEFEKDNINTIEKLRKKKTATTKKINGALKQSINAHGPITKELIGSATKRIYGSILDVEEEKDKISVKDILIGFILSIVIFLGIYLLF